MSAASAAIRSTNFTTTQATSELRTTAGVLVRVFEVGLIQATGTAQSLGLGRPAAQGVTPGTVTTFVRDAANEPACVTTQNASWATSPTVPVTFMRRWNSAATIGVGIVWTFPRGGILVPVSASLVIWNITTAVATDVNFAIDE